MNYVRPTQLLSQSPRTLNVKFSYAMVCIVFAQQYVDHH